MKTYSTDLTAWVYALLIIRLNIGASDAKVIAAVLQRTKLATYDDQYTVASVCECRLRCSVQEACLAASYKAPSTCWVFSGGTGGGQSGGSGGGLQLQQDDEFITWLKNEEMAPTTTELTTTTTELTTTTSATTTTPASPVDWYFKSSGYIYSPTKAKMEEQCSKSGAELGLILTTQEYDWIKANFKVSTGYYTRLIVPAYGDGDSYVWYDGPEILSTGVFQDGENFIDDPSGKGPYVVMDTSHRLVKTTGSGWFYVLCKRV